MKFLFILMVIILFSGCSKITYVNVSEKEEYSKIIGKTYKIQRPLVIMSNLADNYKSKKILDYSVTRPPGYNNRYVFWVKTIPIGTNIYIEKVVEYDDLFNHDFKLLIKIDKVLIESELPIRMRSSLTNVTKDNKYIIMNSKYFKEITESNLR